MAQLLVHTDHGLVTASFSEVFDAIEFAKDVFQAVILPIAPVMAGEESTVIAFACTSVHGKKGKVL